MGVESFDPAAMFVRVLDLSAKNLSVEKLLIQLGLDPNNVTYEAIFNRLLDLALANITFASILALLGGIFLISTFLVRTIVPMRALCIVSVVFFLGAAMFAGSVQHFLMYFLALPVNIIRLVQIRNLVKKARSSARGDLSLDWLRPFMTPRHYQKGDVLFRKGDDATEMFLTVSGKFLVTEISIEIPPGHILGELGFVSPKNQRTQSVECSENGEALSITYEKLHEVYLQNPEFGYFFLRLTTDRLFQNHARLASLVDESKNALAALHASKSAGLLHAAQAGTPTSAAVQKIRKVKVIEGGAARRRKAGATTRGAILADNVIAMVPRWKARLAAMARRAPPSTSIEIEAAQRQAQRRRQAIAIVERHANYSAVGGFIPLPIVNVVAIAAAIMRMVRELNRLYGERVEHDHAYGIALGLMGGLVPTGLAKVATSAVASFVPGYNLVGLGVSSVTASAYARSVGRMLIDHFEGIAELERDRTTLRALRRWRNIWRIRLARATQSGFLRKAEGWRP